jgi:hypothetical protein
MVDAHDIFMLLQLRVPHELLLQPRPRLLLIQTRFPVEHVVSEWLLIELHNFDDSKLISSPLLVKL